MKTRYYNSLPLLALLFTIPAIAAQEGPAKWTAHFDLEAKPGNKRTLGEAGLFLPLWQDNHTLFFGDLRTRFDNSDSREGNFGLGIRHMLGSGWNLGFYGYRDRRRSSLGNDYDQVTVGFEALGPEWDFRANTYRPIGSRVSDSGTSSSASLSGSSIQVVTETSEEHALPGYDAEVGWRTPAFDNAATRQLRLYAGGYHFSDNDVTVKGPRLRAELTLDNLPLFGQRASLYLGAEAQDDEARGRQNFVSLRLSIPLGGSHDRAPALSVQERRMTAPVVRDVDIVTRPVVASRQVETATTTADGKAITVISSSSTSGADLPAAVTAAGNNSTVVLSGTFNTDAQINMAPSQTIIGSGSLEVKTTSGHIATLSLSGATIAATGNSTLTALLMADNATLNGITITNPYATLSGNTVSAQGKTGVTISNNTLTSGGAKGGYTVDLLNANNATVSGNTIIATSSGFASALGIRTQGAINATIANNTFSLSGSTQYVVTGSDTSSYTAGSTGNTTNSGVCYFPSGTPTGSVGFSTISCP